MDLGSWQKLLYVYADIGKIIVPYLKHVFGRLKAQTARRSVPASLVSLPPWTLELKAPNFEFGYVPVAELLKEGLDRVMVVAQSSQWDSHVDAVH